MPPPVSQGTESAASSTPAVETTLVDWLARQLTPPGDTLGTFRVYRGALQQWTPLTNTKIVVMSALAPGVDTIVAEEALKLELRVIALLPFPEEQYRKSSSFVWNDATAEENQARQDAFKKLLDQVGRENSFPVPLADDLELSPEKRLELADADLTAIGADGTPRRHERYYAAGECIASYSHLMLAVWDGEKEPSKVGTSAVVLTRLQAAPRRAVDDQ